MGQLVFQATLGGQVNLVGPNTASTYNLNVPAASDTLVAKNTTDTLTNKTLTSPTLTTPILGTPSSGTLTNCTGLPASTGITGTLATTNGGTGLTSFTANGVVYASSTSALSTGSGLTWSGTALAVTGTLSATGIITGNNSIKSTTAAAGQPEFVLTQTSVASWSIYNPPSSTDLRFYNGSDLLTLNSTSLYTASAINVGIGTSSPTEKLQVVGKILATGDGRIGVKKDGSDSVGAGPFFGMEKGDATRAWFMQLGASNTFDWWYYGGGASYTKHMTLDSSGNLGIGTTSTTAVRLIAKGSTSNGTSNAFKLIDSADADILAMSTAGDFYLPKMGSSTGTTVVLTSGNYLVKSSSSIRYKKDVEPIDIGLNFVLGLNPVKYKMKLDDANQVGFIAEDFPDERLVSFSLVNPQDKQSELQRESVNYANLVAPLVKAIQEQQSLITQLTARITALESA